MNKIYQELEILTITYKSDHIIKKCLSNIDENFKVTIVENSNNNDFKEGMEKRKNTRCILTGANLGFGSAFNIGAKQIDSKYIFHINPDVLVETEIIFKMYEIAKGISDLGIISARETNKISEIKKEIKKDYIEVDHVKGFVMLINNLNCKYSEYFDENFFLYLEEIDLCKRLKLLDKKICLAPNIYVKHFAGKSHDPSYSEKMEIQRNWHYMWSLFYFNKKHKNILYAFKITIGKFISAFLKMIIFFVINKKKHLIYKHRFLGLLNGYLNKKSKFRI
ncbi:glycosyltransferase [Pelagibacterales bacterium SAG-MED47]|nr:glycosyltransferase [Pelagibacterales bacterium SAG-MED47]